MERSGINCPVRSIRWRKGYFQLNYPDDAFTALNADDPGPAIQWLYSRVAESEESARVAIPKMRRLFERAAETGDAEAWRELAGACKAMELDRMGCAYFLKMAALLNGWPMFKVTQFLSYTIRHYSRYFVRKIWG